MTIKNACFIPVLSSLVLLSLTTEARAQNPKTAHAAILFEFCVEGSCLPAGDYIIEQVESTSYLLFRSTDGKSIAAVLSLPVDEDSATEADSKLIFRVEKGRHYLYGGWGPFGRRVVAVESAWAAPSGAARKEVPITFTQASRE
ncbi:MAG: hypothetical protein WA655_17865 [Candidatus Korobacteraceae bacterium]